MLQGDGVLERGVNTEALGRRSWPSALRRTAQRSPARENARVAGGTPYEIWYTADCSEWTVLRITLETGSRRIKGQDAWAKEPFPTVHARVKQARERSALGGGPDDDVVHVDRGRLFDRESDGPGDRVGRDRDVVPHLRDLCSDLAVG